MFKELFLEIESIESTSVSFAYPQIMRIIDQVGFNYSFLIKDKL